MPIKALNDRKKLSSDFNEANDAFIDAVLGALQAGEMPAGLPAAQPGLASGWLRAKLRQSPQKGLLNV